MSKNGKYTRSAPPRDQKPAPGEAASPEPTMTPRQRAWEIVKAVLTYGIMALSVAMMIFTVISIRSFDRNDRDILGFKFFIVRSDSMSATDFSAGDLVIIRETDPATLLPGDIVSFLSDDPNTLGETFTHKIRQITTAASGEAAFVTYGTTTGADDVYPVPFSRVLGKYLFSIPNMGTVFAFMKTPMGYVFCIGVPFLLMLLIQGSSMITSARQMYREKEEAAQDARKEELEAQQKTLKTQQAAIRRLFQEVKALQTRVEALEQERSSPQEDA